VSLSRTASSRCSCELAASLQPLAFNSVLTCRVYDVTAPDVVLLPVPIFLEPGYDVEEAFEISNRERLERKWDEVVYPPGEQGSSDQTTRVEVHALPLGARAGSRHRSYRFGHKSSEHAAVCAGINIMEHMAAESSFMLYMHEVPLVQLTKAAISYPTFDVSE